MGWSLRPSFYLDRSTKLFVGNPSRLWLQFLHLPVLAQPWLTASEVDVLCDQAFGTIDLCRLILDLVDSMLPLGYTVRLKLLIALLFTDHILSLVGRDWAANDGVLCKAFAILCRFLAEIIAFLYGSLLLRVVAFVFVVLASVEGWSLSTWQISCQETLTFLCVLIAELWVGRSFSGFGFFRLLRGLLLLITNLVFILDRFEKFIEGRLAIQHLIGHVTQIIILFT